MKRLGNQNLYSALISALTGLDLEPFQFFLLFSISLEFWHLWVKTEMCLSLEHLHWHITMSLSWWPSAPWTILFGGTLKKGGEYDFCLIIFFNQHLSLSQRISINQSINESLSVCLSESSWRTSLALDDNLSSSKVVCRSLAWTTDEQANSSLPGCCFKSNGCGATLSMNRTAGLVIKMKCECARGEPGLCFMSPGSRDTASHTAGPTSHSWTPGSESWE